MPHVKPKTCHKCGQMYTGWRCPYCYRKARAAGRSSRAISSGGGRRSRRFGVSGNLGLMSLAMVAAAAPAAPPDDRYNDPRNCRHCGFFTTTHPCSYCGKD